MRFTVERTPLLRALGHVTGIVERRNTIPILSNVLITGTTDNSLTLQATDLDIEAVETVKAQVVQPGSVTVPALTLHDIVRKLPDGSDISIALKPSEGRLTVSSGRAQFELAILPADDFPNMGEADLPVNFEVEAGTLKRLLEKVRFAISTEETRYYLNGIYLHVIQGDDGLKLRAVATDGHRLARVESDAPEGSAGMKGVIVPRKAIAEIIKLLDAEAAPVKVSLSETKIRFEIGDVVVTSKLIDGSFPDYARVIPTTNKKLLHVDNSALVKAVDRVATLASERGRAVKLRLEDGKIVISINNSEFGSATEEISADYANDALEIGFNAKYLLDITAQIESARAAFKFADAASPTLVSDESDASALYVLMPMRV